MLLIFYNPKITDNITDSMQMIHKSKGFEDDLIIETLDLSKHDINSVAQLISLSDENINPLLFGKDPEKTIKKLIELGNNYFSPPYTQCAVYKGQIVGIIVGFRVNEKTKLDQRSGLSFVKAMGLLSFIGKIPFIIKLDKVVSGDMDPDGYYIHQLSVDPVFQNRGFGSTIINTKAHEHKKLYLHVNYENERAVSFYKKVGFRERSRGSTSYKGKCICECLMVKNIVL